MRLGIVLGAGGSLGWAFHLGVLEGIREVTGQGPDDAALVLGTSAGGAIGASALSGAGSEQVLDAIGAPLSPEQQAEMQAIRSNRRPWYRRILQPQSPSMVRRGGLVGLAGLLPEGVFPTVPLRRFPTAGLDGWPSSLWIPSVRLGDGALVVFGRDRLDVAPADAIEATSAVPFLFRPKQIGSDRFIDGAVSSATHADLLAPFALDAVVISSPMTRPGRSWRPAPVRWRAARQLAAEAATVSASGAAVTVIEPDEEIMTIAEGFPRSRPEQGMPIVAAAKERTVSLLAKAVR